MAGILDPKKRFFDTYLTNEGRKQMSTGELRMRFVSFSDGLTGYEQSELGVIDGKDGSLFFESMSRPQDNIITENKSVVNMMEVRSPDRQPAFLFKKITDAEGNVIERQPLRASMFGTQIYEPPNGKQILAVSSSGIDRKPVEYNPSKSFFVSGSTTQQVFYDNTGNRLMGWWQFDMNQTQIASVNAAASDDANLSFLFGESGSLTNLGRASIDYHGQPTDGNTLQLIQVSKTGSTLTKTYEFDSNSTITGGNVAVAIGSTADETYSNLAAAINSSLGHNSGIANSKLVVKHTQDSNSSSGNILIEQTNAGTAGNTDITATVANATIPARFTGGSIFTSNPGPDVVSKIAQNEVRQSDLETNAAYMFINNNKSIIPDNVELDNASIRYFVPDNEKSFKGQANRYIRINTLPSLYPVEGSGLNKNKFSSQISVWFYLNDINAGKTNVVFQLFDRYVTAGGAASRVEVARVYTVTNVLYLQIFDHKDGAPDTTGDVFSISDVVKPTTWHRISLAFNDDYIFLVLDGNLEKSIQKAQPFTKTTSGVRRSFHLTSSSDLILGNAFTNANVLSRNPALDHIQRNTGGSPSEFINGFIQECQYFLVPSGSPLPAIPETDPLANQRLRTKIAEKNFNVHAHRKNLIANNSTLITYYDQFVEVDENLRKWINYFPISDEVALYLAGIENSRPFVTEEIMARGVKRIEMDEILEKVQMVMSGTLFAYQDLRLLGHLDVNVQKDQQGLEITRRKFNTEGQGDNKRTYPGEFLPVDPDYARVFKTKLEAFPFIDSVFGQKNDYRKPNTIPHIRSSAGPAGGKFFEREATVYHLNEVIDNEFDNDELTRSSSRLPNFMFLPPISRQNFKFREISDPVTRESALSWTEFLRRRAANTVWYNTLLGERSVEPDVTRETYLREMHRWYNTLIPEETLKNLLDRLRPEENDSNEQLITYLTRPINSAQKFRNKITFDELEQFDELITFTKTSEFNNSYVQMFEVSEGEGKANFTKLAIRDLGVVRRVNRAYADDYRGRRVNNVIANFEDNALDATENKGASYPELAHVFAFGKIFDDNSDPTSPGTDIFFQPIFIVEFIIGDD